MGRGERGVPTTPVGESQGRLRRRRAGCDAESRCRRKEAATHEVEQPVRRRRKLVGRGRSPVPRRGVLIMEFAAWRGAIPIRSAGRNADPLVAPFKGRISVEPSDALISSLRGIVRSSLPSDFLIMNDLVSSGGLRPPFDSQEDFVVGLWRSRYVGVELNETASNWRFSAFGMNWLTKKKVTPSAGKTPENVTPSAGLARKKGNAGCGPCMVLNYWSDNKSLSRDGRLASARG